MPGAVHPGLAFSCMYLTPSSLQPLEEGACLCCRVLQEVDAGMELGIQQVYWG